MNSLLSCIGNYLAVDDAAASSHIVQCRLLLSAWLIGTNWSSDILLVTQENVTIRFCYLLNWLAPINQAILAWIFMLRYSICLVDWRQSIEQLCCGHLFLFLIWQDNQICESLVRYCFVQGGWVGQFFHVFALLCLAADRKFSAFILLNRFLPRNAITVGATCKFPRK